MTAGNGPVPAGLNRTPVRSYFVPSTVPLYVHVAPAVDVGSPLTSNASTPGDVETFVLLQPAVASREQGSTRNAARRCTVPMANASMSFPLLHRRSGKHQSNANGGDSLSHPRCQSTCLLLRITVAEPSGYPASPPWCRPALALPSRPPRRAGTLAIPR